MLDLTLSQNTYFSQTSRFVRALVRYLLRPGGRSQIANPHPYHGNPLGLGPTRPRAPAYASRRPHTSNPSALRPTEELSFLPHGAVVINLRLVFNHTSLKELALAFLFARCLQSTLGTLGIPPALCGLDQTCAELSAKCSIPLPSIDTALSLAFALALALLLALVLPLALASPSSRLALVSAL